MKKHYTVLSRSLVCLMTMVNALQPTYAASRMPASAANPLTDQEILTASSSGNLKLTKGRLITDNDAAFEQKLKIVEAAKKNLYLTYYIYSDDYSSSKFNLALIKKAQSGTNVHLIVDLATNYSRMDLFRFLEAQGNAGKGTLTVKFYNKPSAAIQTDAYYLTLPCSHENQVADKKDLCQAEKEKIVAAGNFTPEQQAMQKLYLASYYTKNGAGLKVATVGGQQVDVENAKQQMEADKAKKEDFLKLKKKGTEANDTGSISAALKAKSLLEGLAAEIDPTMNLMTGFLPTDSIQQKNKNDWDHISDYTHQKMILADVGDGKYMFELGGRNIEDSYHVKPEFLKQLKGDEKQKYLFRDTDFYGEVASGGEGLVAAFMRNWEFTEMVATTKEMDAIAPIDLSIGVAACDSTSPEFQQCVGQFFATATPASLGEKAQQRVMKIAQNTMQRAAKFEEAYVKPTNDPKAKAKHLISFRGLDKSDELSANDLNSALITYIENLNTRKDTATSKRTFGAVTGQEMETGKYISHLWQRGMENACAMNQKTQVILHTAYLLPSSSLMKTLGKMIDGTWDCRQVTIKIITNSFDTTDLNIINIFARAQVQTLFNKYIGGYNANSALLSYYEYVKPEGQTESLHTKLSLFGNDMIDGSANADVRSYYMDSNNGVYLRNVKDLSLDYQNYIDDLIRAGTIVESTNMFATYDADKKAWTLKDYSTEVSSMTDKFIKYWIGRSKNPQETTIKHATAIKIVKQMIEGKAKDAFDANTAMLTPSKFQEEASVIRKACANKASYEYDSCVEKVTVQGAQAVDPKFNLDFEAF